MENAAGSLHCPQDATAASVSRDNRITARVAKNVDRHVSGCLVQLAGECVQDESFYRITVSRKIYVAVPVKRGTKVARQGSRVRRHSYSVGNRLDELAIAIGVKLPQVVAIDHINPA